MKFVTKPCEIEAIQWTDNTTEILSFCGEYASYNVNDASWQVGKGVPVETLTIQTLEGDVQAQRGDFIIKGTHGEFYPCKPDIFATKYEPNSKDFDKSITNFSSKDVKYIILDGDYTKLTHFIINNFVDKKVIALISKLINFDSLTSNRSLLIHIPCNEEYPSEQFLLLDSDDDYMFFNDCLYISNTTCRFFDKQVKQLKSIYEG